MTSFVSEGLEKQESKNKKNQPLKNVYMILLHNQNRNRQFIRETNNYYEKALSDIITDSFIVGTDMSTNVQFMCLAKDSSEAYPEVFPVPFGSITDWFADYLSR